MGYKSEILSLWIFSVYINFKYYRSYAINCPNLVPVYSIFESGENPIECIY